MVLPFQFFLSKIIKSSGWKGASIYNGIRIALITAVNWDLFQIFNNGLLMKTNQALKERISTSITNPDGGNGLDKVKSLVEKLIENTFETLTEEDSENMDSEMMIFTGVKISEYMLDRYKSMDKLYKKNIKNS